MRWFVEFGDNRPDHNSWRCPGHCFILLKKLMNHWHAISLYVTLPHVAWDSGTPCPVLGGSLRVPLDLPAPVPGTHQLLTPLPSSPTPGPPSLPLHSTGSGGESQGSLRGVDWESQGLDGSRVESR